MKVLAVAADIRGLVAGIRLLTPLRALCMARGWSLTERSFHDCTRAEIAAADVLVVQRALSARALRLQHAMRRGGGTVLHDIDDLLTDLPAHISNRAFVSARQAELHDCLLTCDLVTVSTARLAVALAADLRRGAGGRPGADTLPEFAVVPNASLPFCPANPPDKEFGAAGDGAPWPDTGRDVAVPAAGERITLLIASSDRLDAGFLYPALRSVQAARPAAGGRLQIVVVGPPCQDFEAAGLEVQRVAPMPRAAFISFVRPLPGVVAVIPLEDSRFAACKSAIKWFEYAEAGVPVMCSAVSPYKEVVEDGRTGWLVENDSSAWQSALTVVTGDAALRRRTVAAAQAAVRERHGPEHTVAAWGRAIDRALAVRAEAPLPDRAPLGGIGRRLIGAADALLVAARRLNRERLSRRSRAGR